MGLLQVSELYGKVMNQMLSNTISILLLLGGGVPEGGGGRGENNSLFIWFIGISCFTYHPALWAPTPSDSPVIGGGQPPRRRGIEILYLLNIGIII